jgi:carboxylesterase type B
MIRVSLRATFFASVVPILTASVVTTLNGPVVGQTFKKDLSLNSPISQDVDAYLGIPFAKPPVGQLRFRPPVRFDEIWESPFKATTMPPKCVSASGGQEDCLYLNVFRPSASSKNPRAVLVWIYGGGFSSGSIRNYDGSALAAAEDVIVVMGNYRLGALGFLSSDWSFKESGTTGNWGLLDQRATLEWIKENIANFGGDPSTVTIFGESAGAFSVVSHLVSEGSAGLFSGAIIQSGTTEVEMFYQRRKDADAYNEWYAKVHLNCLGGLEDVQCLRRVPSARFVISQTERDGWGAPSWGGPIFPMFTSSPVIDGVVLTNTPYRLALQGKINPGIKSIVIGTTQDEGSVFTTQLVTIVRPMIHFPPEESELRRTFDYMLQDEEKTDFLVSHEFPKYREFYNQKTDPEKPEFRDAEFQFTSSVIRNAIFACPTVTFAEAARAAGIKVHVYNFALKFWSESTKNFPVGQFLGSLGNLTTTDLGAFHSSDVPFVMKMFLNRNITLNDITSETPYAIYMAPAFTKPGDVLHQVSDVMGCFWANVARCGSVDCQSCQGVTWPEYFQDTRKFLSFQPDGTYAVRQVVPSGESVVGEAFPPLDRCEWYMDLRTPFHDLRSDLALPMTLAQEWVDMNKGADRLWSIGPVISLIAVTSFF